MDRPSLEIHQLFYRLNNFIKKTDFKLIKEFIEIKRKWDVETIRGITNANENRFADVIAKPDKRARYILAPRGLPRLRYIRNCAVTITSRKLDRIGEKRELTSTWRSSLSARIHTRPAFLPPVPLPSSVVINRSEILSLSTRRERNKSGNRPEKKRSRLKTRSPFIHPRPCPRERVASSIVSLYELRFSLSAAMRMKWMHAERRCVYASFSEKGQTSRRAAQLTPLTARSWLNATPEREGAGREYVRRGAQIGANTRNRDLATCRGALRGALIDAGITKDALILNLILLWNEL